MYNLALYRVFLGTGVVVVVELLVLLGGCWFGVVGFRGIVFRKRKKIWMMGRLLINGTRRRLNKKKNSL